MTGNDIVVIEYPAWDNAFFQKRICAVNIQSAGEDISAVVRRENAEMFYIFIDSGIEAPYRNQLLEIGAVDYGKRRMYHKEILFTVPAAGENVVILSQASEETYALVFQSGHCSRFFLDPFFREYFEPLYRHWLDKAFNTDGYTLLGVNEESGPSGILLLADSGNIELLAVSEQVRRKGIARSLVNAAESLIGSKGLFTLTVGTQDRNEGACRFYEVMGFQLKSSTAIWHLWKKPYLTNHI